MPEIGEVARIVHYLRKHLVGRTISKVLTQEDNIIYGKVGTSAAEFEKSMSGKRVLDARQQGKYFYLVMSAPPHPVMHFGMTGWIKFSNDESGYYKPKNEAEMGKWPPRFWKFVLQTEAREGDGESGKGCEVAFVDARRLARIRLIDADGEDLRNQSPLKENGPDPVIDKEIVTVDWLTDVMRKKHVPVKALLLDQAVLSGVGNWVADEVLYQAKIHPEQYSNTFGDDQIKSLHDSLINVCTTAVETLSDSSKFPEHWIMRHRWGKGKKDSNTLPNGEKITFLKVGGRTSAVVLSRQKKTGAVAGGAEKAEEEALAEAGDGAEDVVDGGDEEEIKDTKIKTKPQGRKRKSNDVKQEDENDEHEHEHKPRPRGKRAKKSGNDDEKEIQADVGADKVDEKMSSNKKKSPKAQRAAKVQESPEVQQSPKVQKSPKDGKSAKVQKSPKEGKSPTVQKPSKTPKSAAPEKDNNSRRRSGRISGQ